jgi:uncharacterized membrane protein
VAEHDRLHRRRREHEHDRRGEWTPLRAGRRAGTEPRSQTGSASAPGTWTAVGRARKRANGRSGMQTAIRAGDERAGKHEQKRLDRDREDEHELGEAAVLLRAGEAEKNHETGGHGEPVPEHRRPSARDLPRRCAQDEVGGSRRHTSGVAPCAIPRNGQSEAPSSGPSRGSFRRACETTGVMPRSFTVLAAWAGLAVLVAVTVIGLVSYWPRDRTLERPAGLTQPKTERAEIVAVARATCRTPTATNCVRATAELRSGPDDGQRTQLTLGDQGPIDIDVGDEVRLFRNKLPEGAVLGGTPVDPYTLADFERRGPLLWLALGFALLVAATGRLRGLRALLGLAASLAVVIGFVVPAILDGRDPVGVALVGALAAMLVTLPLAHGLGVKTLAAALGTGASLLLTLALADAYVGFAHLTGLSSDEAVYLRATAGDVSIQGLLLAGMVIGALGVLDDTTVSQASTVLAIRRANPALAFRQLFRSGLAVGHDHIAATVNTLILAYAGAALPVLLIFNLGGVSFSDAVNNEAVAEQIVAMLVGSIGLIAAVPMTTALAAALALRTAPSRELHAHGHAV